MSADMTSGRGPTSLREALVASVAAAGAILVGLAAVAVGTRSQHLANPPVCFGIGWGCTPDWATWTTIVAMLFGAPALGAAVVLVIAGWIVGQRRPTVGRALMWTPSVLIGLTSVVLAMTGALDA